MKWHPSDPSPPAPANTICFDESSDAWAAAETRIPGFLCPSANAYQNSVGTMSCYHGCATDHPQDPPDPNNGWGYGSVYYYAIGGGGERLGRTNYLPVGGGFGVIGNTLDRWRGVFCNRSVNRMSGITDGTSNTLLIGEYAGGYNDEGNLDFSACWMGASGMFSAYSLARQAGNGSRPGWWQFGSSHPGVVQFAFADGSVPAIAHTIREEWPDKRYFRYLSAMADGNVVPGDALP